MNTVAPYCQPRSLVSYLVSKFPKIKTIALFSIFLLANIQPLVSYAGSFAVYGPQTFYRTTGKPEPISTSFTAPMARSDYQLVLDSNKVSSAIVGINGVEIFGPSAFNRKVTSLQKAVSLDIANTLAVELRSQPGSSLTVTVIGIDNVPPTITYSVAPAANAARWHNQDVTVSFQCDDDFSGIATCPAPTTVTMEGESQIISGTAIDVAGNTATTSVTIHLDKTPPTITTSIQPLPNTFGWNNTDVTVNFNCSDTLSGIATCPAPVIVSTEAADQVVTGTATDIAGNSTTASVTVNLDKTGPTITNTVAPTANTAGWHNTDVTITYVCEDTLSGIATCPPPNTVTTEGTAQVVTGQAIDKAGNNGSSSVTLNIDKTAPNLIISSPAAGTIQLDNPPTISLSYSDTNSVDIDSIEIQLNGQTLTVVCVKSATSATCIPGAEFSSGTQTLQVTIADIAGNTAVAQVTFEQGAPDSDGDGVLDSNDICPGTPAGEPVDANGCALSQLDSDNDGVSDANDLCPSTPAGETVDAGGCSLLQPDTDGDGVSNVLDQCPNTPVGEAVDVNGCSVSQRRDSDFDGVVDALDQCPNTPFFAVVDANGCSYWQRDSDNDGVIDVRDQCPNTPAGEAVDTNGCAPSQLLDSDFDGVIDIWDQCPNTSVGEAVDANGCALSQLDTDNDGVSDVLDQCPNTPAGETVDADGCAISQLDFDNDGVSNGNDACPDTPVGATVNFDGCALSQLDSDGDNVSDALDQCPNTPVGETVNFNGCALSQLDSDGDSVSDALDQCPDTPAGETVDVDGCAISQLDFDNDGISNGNDACPNTPAGESTDANGCGPSQLDSDSDGVSDANDICPSTASGSVINADGCALITVGIPVNGQVIITGLEGAVEPSAELTIQNYSTGETVVLTTNADGSFSTSIAAQDGDVLYFTVTDSSGVEINTFVKGVGNVIGLSVTSPLQWAVIDSSTVLVTGTFSGPPNTSIVVNGIQACTVGNDFYINYVPLELGDNTITVTATISDGLTETKDIVVSSTSSGVLPIEVTATPACGFPPMDVVFNVTNNTGYGIQNIEVDVEGDGIIDVSSSDINLPPSHIYQTPGIYTAKVTVTDGIGSQYVSDHVLVVKDVTEMDLMLRSVYFGMLDRLKVGAIDGALNKISYGMRSKYQNIFNILKDDLPTITDQQKNIIDGSFNDEYAEYIVVRDDGNGPQAFFIYLNKGRDGIWRTEGM